MMGGKLRVVSQVGVGSLFYFRLPFAIAPDNAPCRSVPSGPELRGIRVLIDRCYDAAVVALNEHRPKLDALAEALLAKETLDEEEATDEALTELAKSAVNAAGEQAEAAPLPAAKTSGRPGGSSLPLGGPSRNP